MPPTPDFPDAHHRYQFVTGKLAASALRGVVEKLAQKHGFDYVIDVLPITVAALMTPKWLSRNLHVHDDISHVILPGFLKTDPDWPLKIPETTEVLVGPKDCRELPEWFGDQRTPPDLSRHDIEIIAEINHVPRLSTHEFLRQSKYLIDQGADRIDIGCDPSRRCRDIADYVRAAVEAGIQVSIDTFDSWEASTAVGAGAGLVLSVNSTNRDQASDWGCEVVAIPDSPSDLSSLFETAEFLEKRSVPHRLDAILEPIGSGLFASLERYAETRRRFPSVGMMMGIGNVTELTDVDSAGLNFLLLAICQELKVDSVLTTQVINWARSSVRECDVARRLVRHAITESVPPKRLSDELVMLRDPRLRPFPEGALDDLANAIRDNNYRIFAQDDQLHLLSAGIHLSDGDAFRLFERLMQEQASDNVDASHAFYLGYELAKATISIQLGKQYEQDRSLDWGMLTVQEDLHRLTRTSRHRKG